MSIISRIVRRLRGEASTALLNAGQALASRNFGDGWNGMTALGAKTVLDIGACGGELAERELLGCFPHAQIHCFEPHPLNFAKLQRTSARHPRMHAHQVALGASEGEVEMKFNPNSPSSSSLLDQTDKNIEIFPFLEETEQTMVRQRRLDDVMGELAEAPGPMVIKMDVQGMEQHVIAGGRQTFAAAAGVVLEVQMQHLYEGQAEFDGLYRELSGMGFRFAGTRDQYFGKQGEVIYLDACFLRDGR